MRGYAQQLMAKKLLATSGNHKTLARLNETPNRIDSQFLISKNTFNSGSSPMHSITNLSNYKNLVAM